MHKLAGRFRLEGLRSDDQVPESYKVLPLVLFSHEPLTTWCLAISVPLLYLFLGGSIVAGLWTAILTASKLATIAVLATVAAFGFVVVFELHHLTVEQKRVQPSACWAWSTFLQVGRGHVGPAEC